jgi:D-glycero-D-manno-heptose 1,7-bisphosphate phosphatase
MRKKQKVKAAFIDRDGVINEERGYVYRVQDFNLLPGVVDGLSMLQDAGYILIIITNQSGIARGYYSMDDLDVLHNHLIKLLKERGVVIYAIYFCPHHPLGNIKGLNINCDCRKPSPGMILKAANEFNINLNESILIGDKITDIQAGIRAGVGRNIIVESGHKIDFATRLEADIIARDLHGAAKIITKS